MQLENRGTEKNEAVGDRPLTFGNSSKKLQKVYSGWSIRKSGKKKKKLGEKRKDSADRRR